jgi:hypothetical protein
LVPRRINFLRFPVQYKQRQNETKQKDTETKLLTNLTDTPTKNDLLELEFGNKISILAGDYLLAQGRDSPMFKNYS